MSNYQLRIELLRIKPPIWRLISVPGTVTLATLHLVLQRVMGWENYHIYLFAAGRQQFGEGVREWSAYDQRVVNAKGVTLQEIVQRKGARFTYTYDMGDGWEHEIRVEEIREGAPEKARCLDGARSCPPEDCGGPHGYQDLLDVIFDPTHPQYQEIRDWLGDTFAPERFNVEIVNRSLLRMKVGRQAA